jgi:hypothetical protein
VGRLRGDIGLHQAWAGTLTPSRKPVDVVSLERLPTNDVRMVRTLLAEQDDEWQVSDRRRYFGAGSMANVGTV